MIREKSTTVILIGLRMCVCAMAWMCLEAQGGETAPAVPAAAPGTRSSGAISAMSDFESPDAPSLFFGHYGTPIAVMNGEGAFGSKGFLRAGPHTGKWVIPAMKLQYTATKETKLGFSARKPGGGAIGVFTVDKIRKINVSKRGFALPADGSWATFCVPITWFGVAENTPMENIFFECDNAVQAPLSFDIDNVCLFNGKPEVAPQAPGQVAAVFDGEAAQLKWIAPNSACSLTEYRIYRGLRGEFPRGKRTLIGQTSKASFTDSAFAHDGKYCYAVRAVDFAGSEGPDDGAHGVEVTP